MDIDGDQCVNFVFVFGDGTSPVLITSSIISRPYSKPGVYIATVIVTDKYGQPVFRSNLVEIFQILRSFFESTQISSFESSNSLEFRAYHGQAIQII